MHRQTLAALVLFAAVSACHAPSAAPIERAPAAPPTRLERVMTHEVAGQRLSYLLDVPVGEAPREGWPLVLFLHGAGERGDDLTRVAVHGPPKLAHTTPALWGCVIVSPLCPDESWWLSEPLVALLGEVENEFPIDTNRVYATGLSMGGFGTFELLATHADLFAAAVPICGGMREDREPSIVAARDVPIRVFHGGSDNIVPLGMSERVVAELTRVGADVELTIYPGVGHDSWTRTYEDPALWAWMFAQRRR